MTDVWFIVAGWGVILVGLGLYAVALLRRLRAALEAAAGDGRDAESGSPGATE